MNQNFKNVVRILVRLRVDVFIFLICIFCITFVNIGFLIA